MENSLFSGVPKFRQSTVCLNIGTPKNINFPFETNGKLMILGVPILKHFRVSSSSSRCEIFGFSNASHQKLPHDATFRMLNGENAKVIMEFLTVLIFMLQG